jgi:hypothetical protein
MQLTCDACGTEINNLTTLYRCKVPRLKVKMGNQAGDVPKNFKLCRECKASADSTLATIKFIVKTHVDWGCEVSKDRVLWDLHTSPEFYAAAYLGLIKP